MAKYRKIDPRIWNDAKFLRIGPMGQMLFLYVLTHPNMTMLGMLRSTKEAIAFERGWDLLAFNQVFELALRLGLLEYDPVGLIACPNFLKYNEPESITVVKSWGKIQDFLPECDLYFKYLNRAKEYCKNRGKAFEKSFNEAFSEAKFEPNLEPNDLFSGKANSEARAYQRTKNKEQRTKKLNTTKQQTEVCNEEPASEEEVCSEDFPDSIADQAENLAIDETLKVVDDPDAIVTPVQVIGIARMLGVKVYRSEKLNQVCSQKILTVDNIRQCVRVAKKEQKCGRYLVGILANAVNEPSQYHTWEYLDLKHKEDEAGIDWDKPF